MIDSLEDYHTCTVCARPVHDYGPGADAECINGGWFHRSCQEPKGNRREKYGCTCSMFDPPGAECLFHGEAI